jgi:sugar lactone lactonase YvrE
MGYSGDGGAANATGAELDPTLVTLTGVALDAAGNIYFADTANNCIRKVTASTGIISPVTICNPPPPIIYGYNNTGGYSGDGGPAASAQLKSPQGVAMDSLGNLYIADTGNYVIREVTALTGIITTVPVTGPETDDSSITPTGIAADSLGNLYIADSYNNVILKVPVSTGIATEVVGSGPAGYSGDGGPAYAAHLNILNYSSGVAVDASGDIYFADTGNNVIRKVTASTGIITTVAGSSAGLSNPRGVAVDTAGNLYIADTGHNRIREVAASTGIITTLAGSTRCGYAGDSGAATSAKLCDPSNVALDAVGNLYIADSGNVRIREVMALTGIITTVAGDGTKGYGGDGGAATAIGAEMNLPQGVARDTAGNLYIADSGNGVIRKVTASTGIITTVAGGGSGCSQQTDNAGDGCPATSAKLVPYGVALDAAGNIYFADTGNNRIRVVTASAGIITTIAGNGSGGTRTTAERLPAHWILP